MSEVINVDFVGKRKIEKYVITRWVCVICKGAHEFDSRSESNAPRIIFHEGGPKRNEECICKNCAINVKSVVDNQGWRKDV